MDDTSLHVTARTSASEGLVLAVEGYLDEDGGSRLAKETRAAQGAEQRRIRIDLGEVGLFNCSGARQLITLLNDLEELGYEVDLVGVHPPLQRLLDLST
jgi:anti-anti-sigma regulatory factor